MARKRPRVEDDCVRQITEALGVYQAAHPKAKIEVYRQNSAAIRIRIIDPDFTGRNLTERDDAVWRILDSLPEDVLSHIYLLLLFTPREAKTSFANYEFDHPIPSRL